MKYTKIYRKINEKMLNERPVKKEVRKNIFRTVFKTKGIDRKIEFCYLWIKWFHLLERNSKVTH